MKVASIVLTLAVGLLLIEGGMRAAGVILLAPARQQNAIAPADAQRLRILAVGESTSQDFFATGSDGAWPRTLETELRHRGINARVYNEARGGLTSPFHVSRLRKLLELYRPQIVITLMGINDDRSTLRYDDNAAFRRGQTFAELRVVRLVRWVRDRVTAAFTCRLDRPPRDPAIDAGPIAAGIALARREPIARVEQELRRTIPDDHELGLALLQVGRQLDQGQAYVDRAFALFPLHHDIAFWELVGLRGDPDRCAAVSAQLLRCGLNIPDEILAQIENCLPPAHRLKAADSFVSRGLSPVRPVAPLTAYHYRTFHRILQEHHALHIAMQYPTMPLDDLKAYFREPDGRVPVEFQDIEFVTNQDNFHRALGQHPYDEVFRDRFRVTWGHPTSFGHRLIAESALAATLRLRAQMVSSRESR